MAHENRVYLWLDIETTGDRPQYDDILEVGWFFTDHKLERLIWQGDPDDTSGTCPGGNTIVAQASDAWKRKMIPIVAEMHEQSGLTLEIAKAAATGGGETLRRVEKQILYDMHAITELYGNPEFVLAGSGISQLDMPFMKAQMPDLAGRLMYFMLDIGQVRRFLMDVAEVKLTEAHQSTWELFRKGGHRAYSDALSHWQEAKFWVDVMHDLQYPLDFFTTSKVGEGDQSTNPVPHLPEGDLMDGAPRYPGWSLVALARANGAGEIEFMQANHMHPANVAAIIEGDRNFTWVPLYRKDGG